MESLKIKNIICVLLFVGIILSCAVIFGSNVFSLKTDEENISVTDSFNSLFFNDQKLNEIKNFIGAKAFNVTHSENVIIGKDNFMFMLESSTFPYLDDFKGRAQYEEKELETIYNALVARKKTYAFNGTEYYVVFIPNSQTVYSDYMPLVAGKPSENTRLSSLCRYLDENNFVSYVNPSELLKTKTGGIPLYNNTESSVTSAGAYYIFTDIMNRLPAQLKQKNNLHTNLFGKINEYKSTGKELAVTTGLENVIKNNSNTLSSNNSEYVFVVNKESQVFETTYVKPGLKSDLSSRPSILIEYTHNGDKQQFMPYFSNAYGSVGYKYGYSFSSEYLEELYPNAVIQFIREDEIDTLLDETINNSYTEEIARFEKSEVTETPTIIAVRPIDENTTCIVGSVEEGASIIVSGSTFYNYVTESVNGKFIIYTSLKPGEKDTVHISAEVQGKDTSKAVDVKVNYNAGADTSAVAVLQNSQLVDRKALESFYGHDVFSNAKLKDVKSNVEKLLEDIRSTGGTNTKLIFAAIPEFLSFYPEYATIEMKDTQNSSVNALKQLDPIFKDTEDIIFLNLNKSLQLKQWNGNMYYQTKDNWNGTAQYYQYSYVMKSIANDFPHAAPYSRRNFDITEETLPAGEFISSLGIYNGFDTERNFVCTLNVKPKATLVKYDSNGAVRSYINSSTLPRAIIMNCSRSSEIVTLMAEHFSEAIIMPENITSIDRDLVSDSSPDYIIVFINERDLNEYFSDIEIFE